MRIIYIYSNCTDKKYRELSGEGNEFVLRADQKYHSLLIKGLSKNGVKVFAMSSLPINRRSYKGLFVSEADETEGNALHHYYKTPNLPVLRQLAVFCGGFFNVLRIDKKDAWLICDYQNVANAYGALLAAKMRKIPCAVIVMDLPDFLSGNKAVQRIYSGTFKAADKFILLTEQMNGEVNAHNKPYAVVEGIADYSLDSVADNELFENTTGKKTVIYAGSLARLYGIKNLTEGFIKADIADAELWIYGDGDYREELLSVCAKHGNVIYKGVCPNDDVVYAEQRAALLVNPRPTAPDYTKYSFPSKNMEYMASGTPVLTTDLPGMPDEYKPFVFIIEKDKEDADGIAETLKRVFALPKEERYNLGKRAGRLVKDKKSDAVQARKIIEFLERY